MANTQTTAENRKEYFLTLTEYVSVAEQIDETNVVYSVRLGELTPDEAKSVEEYGQGFKWANDNCATELKDTLVRNATNAEQVIFTVDSSDARFIELNGTTRRSIRGGKPFRTKLTVDLPKGSDLTALDEASSRFKNAESEEITGGSELTRYIMNLCIKKAAKLRENPMPTESGNCMKLWIRNGVILSGALIIVVSVLVPAVAYIMGGIVLSVVTIVLGNWTCKRLGLL
ncbi:MAG: hypothetical protein ACRC46_13655 [Thermoguttaceae bacterium]